MSDPVEALAWTSAGFVSGGFATSSLLHVSSRPIRTHGVVVALLTAGVAVAACLSAATGWWSLRALTVLGGTAILARAVWAWRNHQSCGCGREVEGSTAGPFEVGRASVYCASAAIAAGLADGGTLQAGLIALGLVAAFIGAVPLLLPIAGMAT